MPDLQPGAMGTPLDGTPPDGDPPDGKGRPGGGPGGMSQAPTSYSAVTEYSKDTTASGKTYTSTGKDESAILVSGGNAVRISKRVRHGRQMQRVFSPAALSERICMSALRRYEVRTRHNTQSAPLQELPQADLGHKRNCFSPHEDIVDTDHLGNVPVCK